MKACEDTNILEAILADNLERHENESTHSSKREQVDSPDWLYSLLSTISYAKRFRI